MQDHYSLPELIGIASMLAEQTPADRASLTSALYAAASSWLAGERPESRERAEGAEYVPHPLDPLIVGAIEQEGALQQSELLAILDRDTYKSRGRRRKITMGNLKRHLPELVAAGVLGKTPAGYIVNHGTHTKRLNAINFESVPRPRYVPHPIDVLVFAAVGQGGAMQQAELLAALSRDTYESKGQTRNVSARTLQRRLPELVTMGALAKTGRGYIVSDAGAVEAADKAFPEKPARCPANNLPPLTEVHRRVLRKLRRGAYGASPLADAAECSERTIQRWCAEDGPLYRVGVRIEGKVYHWPNPRPELCEA